MLKRILTALIIIPIFVLLIYYLSPKAFCLLTGVIMLWAGWEWSLLMGLKQPKHRFIYLGVLLLVLLASIWLYIPGVIFVTSLWWIIAFVLVRFYPKYNQAWSKGVIVRGLMGFMTLIPCWLAVNFIRDVPGSGMYILLFLFVLVWGADSGAYFAGKAWGKTKLAPAVSPGKTWEGVGGALIISLIVTLTAIYLIHMPYSLWFLACLVSLVTVIFSIVGDLFESMLKRNEGLKDSGHMLPGHGGILDRIDSLTAAAPIFLLGIDLLQKIAS